MAACSGGQGVITSYLLSRGMAACSGGQGVITSYLLSRGMAACSGGQGVRIRGRFVASAVRRLN